MGTHSVAGSSGAFGGSPSYGSAFGHHGSSGAFSNNHNGHGHAWYPNNGNPPLIGHGNRDHSRPMSPMAWWRFLGIIASFGATAGLMWLLSGIYAPEQLEAGLNYSRLLKANRLFVDSISVSSSEQVPGPLLYCFPSQPSLDDEKEWTVNHHVTVPGIHHQEWAFWLNKGSKVHLEYNVPPVSNLVIIVAQGAVRIDICKTNFEEWIQNPRNPAACFVWKSIHDSGQISFEAYGNNDYYIGIGNLNQMSTEIIFKIEIKGRIYETKKADSWCPLNVKACTVMLTLTGSEVGLLTTPDKPQEGLDEWHMTVSYKTRWVTPVCFYGAIVVILMICFSKLRHKKVPSFHPEAVPLNFENGVASHSEEGTSDGSLILYNKSRPKISVGAGQVMEETNDENLCTICYEESKNSFFQPCGHCSTCYNCGLRIKEMSNHCPICRQPIQDVRKIFLV